MQYRTFGQLDWHPSALGFGAMRLPTIGDDHGQIDEEQATQMVHYAIDHGVNYVDTAYPYHKGTSETFLGQALQGGYRERVKLATKMPSWLIEEPADFDRYLDEQLERLQADFVDFYLLHSLNKRVWPPLLEHGVFDWAEKAMAAGRFHHLGFSFHDDYELFQEIVDAYDSWTFCQIQYNYMDEHYQAGTRGLEYAADQGLAVVVMEPIRGGQLARTPPQPVLELWEAAPVQRTPAEWALQWVWDHPRVSLALSGMSAMAHVVENVASAGRSGPGTLTEEELDLIARVRDTYRELMPVSCTYCKYCQPCPSGVNIPRIFQIYNEGHVYDEMERARRIYNHPNWLKPEQRANQCTKCGECEELCPQGIEISAWMERIHQELATDEAATG